MVSSAILLGGSQAAAFDLQTSFLGMPKTLAYGLVRGAGNLVFQQQLSDNSTIAFYLLGEGPWDSLLRIWLDGVEGPPIFPGGVDFHNGYDGEIGFGMGAVSTGSDQHVDQYFSDVVPLTPTTWSRYAYLALRYPPNPLAPDANLTVLADYQAMRCRIFDASGNQTAFQWTQNPAWWICDFLIRKFILREAKAGQPLTAAELNRFDWVAWNDAAAYCDYVIGSGVPRFSDGGLVFLESGMTAQSALEQMLLACQGYILERNGKLTLYIDQPRSSVYLATADSLVPGSFSPYKKNLQQAQNRITATWREESLASGSTDDGTRMSISTSQFDHEANQAASGGRGPGLAVMSLVNELQLDFGINTAERVSRLCNFLLLRQLGLDVDPNYLYNAPYNCDLILNEDSLAVEPGDVITIDGSISEEFAGREMEVLEIEERPDGNRKFTCLEYVPDAFGDQATPRQLRQAPVPGTGLTFPFGLDGSGDLVVPLDQTVDAGARYAPVTGITTGVDLPYNPSFEIWPNTELVADGWTPDYQIFGTGATYARNVFPYEGAFAQKILASAGGSGSIGSRSFGVKPGIQYTFRVRAAADVNGTGRAYVVIDFFSDTPPAGTFTGTAPWIGSSDGAGGLIAAVNGVTYFDVDGVPNPWTLYEGVVTAPQGAKFARFRLGNTSPTIVGNVSFDTCAWIVSQVVPSANAYAVTSLPSTSSTSYVVVPDMDITIETQGQSVLLLFAGTVELISGNLTAYFAIFRDGVQITNDTQFPLNNFYADQVAKISWIDVNPSPGSHTYEVNWKVNGNSMFCYDNRAFQAIMLN
jgi:hypothetical protein